MNPIASIKRRIKQFINPKPMHPDAKPEGSAGVKTLGHREYVGGMWNEIGTLQFEYLKSQGLQPHHVFCDIACGSLRAGVHLINYLDTGNYLGIEKEQDLIDAGINKELGKKTYEQKKPELIASDSFEFSRFTRKPHYSISQSLFTHLTPQIINLCLTNLRAFVEPGHKSYITFFEGDSSQNMNTSHDHAGFRYSPDEMAKFGTDAGFAPTHIGNWNHPRNQQMFLYTAE